MKLEKLIKLGIALDYPVRWSFEKILRDLIQNFYDSVGKERFGTKFHYNYQYKNDSYSLCMKTTDTPFSYDWLIYIGGSTKTGRQGYVGKYGEGFKISILSLWKMGIHSVCMHSEDWQIIPCEYSEEIEGRDIRMLGYRYSRVPDDGLTILTIRGIPRENESILKEGLLHFFYRENPLFGEGLVDSDGYTIFRSSGISVPCRQRPVPKGILYLNHRKRHIARLCKA